LAIDLKIILVCNTAWGLINFRAGLIKALSAVGHEVIALAPLDEHASRIEGMGVRFIAMSMDNKGTNPFRDLRLLLSFVNTFRVESPDLVISYTIKPVIYASLAARWLSISAISVVTGLGTVFLRENLLTKMVEWLYRVSQLRVRKVFFLNDDDLELFRARKLAPAMLMKRLPSEGINLLHFNSIKHQQRDCEGSFAESQRPLQFLLMARMLWDKGIGEYVGAARQVRRLYPDTKFGLLGFLDVQNHSAISREQMDAWIQEGGIEYLGVTNDVRQAISESDCVVLPSYREGISRTLLEAAAMGRPIVTTDTVGCRDVVEDGVNGYLCRSRDSDDLAKKLIQIIKLSPTERKAMGLRGRHKVECEFDEQLVISHYFEVISALAENKPVC
jgi:glycosyltransferase involved in cell wall biosynthesis